MAKKIRWERVPEFRKKGRERQFNFIEEVKERVEAADDLLSKVKTASDRDNSTLKAASEELEAGTKALLMRQKHIRMADRSELRWQVVEAYESDELASGDKDAKRIEKAEKTAEQKVERRRNKAVLKGSRNHPLRHGNQPICDPAMPGPSRAFVPAMALSQMLPPPKRVPGPCFHCLEMGHLKGSCPKLSRMYPLSQSVCESVEWSIEIAEESVNNLDSGEEGGVNRLTVPVPSGPEFEQALVESSEDMGLERPSELCEYGDSRGELEHELNRVWEVSEESQVVDVQGRLRKYISFWEHDLNATLPVLEWIRLGYKLPSLKLPGAFHKGNAQSALDNYDFVLDAIAELCKNRCIQEVKSRPHICSPLSVMSNSQGKKRLVLNLRHFNKFLLKEKF